MNNDINLGIMFKTILCLLLLLTLSTVTVAQYDSQVFGSPDHCDATLVHLQPGYSYIPLVGETMHSYISNTCAALVVISPAIYSSLKKQLDGGYYTANDEKVFFEYDEDYFYASAANLQYKIYKESDLNNSFSVPPILFNIGNNRKMIDISSISSAGYYILEVENSKKEKRYLRFKKL